MQRVWQSLQHWPRNIAIIIIPIIIFIAGGGFAFAYYFGGLGSSSSTTSVNLQKGLVGYWPLVGNTNDTTPYRDNGTNHGATLTTNRYGAANSAYSFNGTSDYINLGTNPVITPANISISVWAKANSFNSWNGIISNMSSWGTGFSLQMGTTQNIAAMVSGVYLKTSWAPSTGVWYHIVATHNASTNLNVLYVNGVEQASVTQAVSYGANAKTYIGVFYTLPSLYFNGSIANVRIYNRALNQNEVTALYHQYNASTQVDTTAQGLVGWWKLNGNTNDTTPYRNNGTNYGAVSTTDRHGVANGAYSFNGSSYIDVPNTSSLNPKSAITISGWIDVSSLSSNQNILGKWDAAGSGRSYFLGVTTAGALTFAVSDNGGYISANQITGTGGITAGTWHHIVVVWSAGQVNFYVDGAAAGTGTTTATTLYTSTTPFEIGTLYSGGVTAAKFVGTLSDIRMYNTALSTTEITTLYNSYNSHIALGGSGQSGSISLTKGLVGYWPLVGNTNDTTPYRDNGTNHGATLTTNRYGAANSAYSFNGTSDYLSVPGTGTMIGQPGLTVSAWVDPLSLSSGTYAIVNKNGPWLLWINATNKNVETGLLQGSTWYWYSSPSGSIVANKWQQITMTYDGVNRKIYINGQLSGAADTQISGNIKTYTGGFSIGYDDCCNRYYFPGYISGVRVYDRALSSAEVAALYNGYY